VSVWAVVVAGGGGTRFGRAKQWELLGGRRVVDWAVEAARSVCDGVVLVVPAWAGRAGDDAPPRDGGASARVAGRSAGAPVCARADVVVAGGPTRAGSVRQGLSAVPGDAEIVVVHDAARPLASPTLFAAVVGAVRRGAAAAVPGVPVADTIKQVVSGKVASTLQREALVAVQTPQAFRADLLRAAHAGAGEATDDAALVEALGVEVVVVEGDPANLKLTYAHDLAAAEALLARGPSVVAARGSGTGAGPPGPLDAEPAAGG
jgi:2-C-methyl-D-erythritol 4-phosphate cytidylyltransferase